MLGSRRTVQRYVFFRRVVCHEEVPVFGTTIVSLLVTKVN